MERVAGVLQLSRVLRSRPLSTQNVLAVDDPSSGGRDLQVDAMRLESSGASVKDDPESYVRAWLGSRENWRSDISAYLRNSAFSTSTLPAWAGVAQGL